MVALAMSVLTMPLVLLGMLLIVVEDGWPAIYVARRVGQGGRAFRMYKLRSMIRDADRTGVDSTAANDPRLLRSGRWLRRLKIDELPRFWNVLRGEMSLVGPRPNVEREVALYTVEERGLLTVRPGITDLASIVFADYELVLRDRPDPDLAYNQLIRPWKSRLGLLYVQSPFALGRELHVIWLTLLTVVSRPVALRQTARLVGGLGGDAALVRVAGRQLILEPTPPPGAAEVVKDRSHPPTASSTRVLT